MWGQTVWFLESPQVSGMGITEGTPEQEEKKTQAAGRTSLDVHMDI